MADHSIWHLTDPWGTPRYYPPGQHPAMYRYREMLKRLEALPQTPEVADAATWYRDQIAAFEATESECKARDHLRLTRR